MADDDMTNVEIVKAALEKLLDKSPLEKFVKVAVHSTPATVPTTSLLHVCFKENQGNSLALADFLWNQALNYALTRKRRDQIRAKVSNAPDGDISDIGGPVNAARNAFIEFHKDYPSRASEVGEVLAYCIALSQLGATQVAAKMSLKTSGNMPVHGLDGIHAKVENGALYIFFLESKLSQSANGGVKEYAGSVAGFGSSVKQYLLEYAMVKDLGNLDSLTGTERELALSCFDVLESPDTVERRERSVGVILYKESLFEKLSPIRPDQKVGFHEEEFRGRYTKKLEHHQKAAMKHLGSRAVDANKCHVYFVAVPDVDQLRELFYMRMGYTPEGGK